jgi:hypothetical protein
VQDDKGTTSTPVGQLPDHRYNYYFLDQAGDNGHGDTALHRLLALHTPPADVHKFLRHAAQHRQLLAATTATPTPTTTLTDTLCQHNAYSHLTARPPSPCEPNGFEIMRSLASSSSIVVTTSRAGRHVVGRVSNEPLSALVDSTPVGATTKAV